MTCTRPCTGLGDRRAGPSTGRPRQPTGPTGRPAPPGPSTTPRGDPDDHGRPSHRRGALPVTVLASAAAVVAAGTFGSHVSTLAAADRPTPAGAANVAGSLTGSPQR